MRILIVALLALAGFGGVAHAEVRPLAPGSGGVALQGDRVLWSSGGSVFSAPVAGGDAARVARLAADALAAGPSEVAAVVGSALYAGSAFTRVTPDLGSPPPFGVVDPVQVSDLGVVALEDGGVWLRAGGRRVEVTLPPGADPEHVAVAGGLGVAPVPEGALVVFDLRSGVERRQISVGAYDPVNPDGLAISATGDVAATLPVGDGTGVLVWAPAGASAVRVLARGERLGRVATAGGRVAYVTGQGLRDGVRPVVVDARGAVMMRGPAALDVGSLRFDGRALAYATPSCRLLLSSSASTIPAGPCSRTDAAVQRLRGGGQVRVACLTAPARACRVRATAGGRSVSARVRRGAARVIAVPRGPLTVRVVDPDGRTRVVR